MDWRSKTIGIESKLQDVTDFYNECDRLRLLSINLSPTT